MKRTAPRSYLEDPAPSTCIYLLIYSFTYSRVFLIVYLLTALQDPSTVVTEGSKSPWGPGEPFVPQHHLFWNEDGSAKVSANMAVGFKKDKRFQAPTI